MTAALRQGCDAVEMDLCVTQDDQLVLGHNLQLSPDLTRDARGQWLAAPLAVRALSLAQLKTFNIGRIRPQSEYRRRCPHQQPLTDTPIPTLAETVAQIEALRSNWRAERPVVSPFNLELKSLPAQPDLTPPINTYVDLVVAALQHHAIAAHTMVQSFDWRLPVLIKKRLPEVTIGLLTDLPGADYDPRDYAWPDREPCAGPVTDVFTTIDNIAYHQSAFWSANHHQLNPTTIAYAHARGLAINAWTVNNSADMQRLLALGVAIITTDYPDRMLDPMHDLRPSE